MARPIKNKEDLLSTYIKIRLTEKENKIIEQKAKQSNRTVSSYGREVLFNGVVMQIDKTKPKLLAELGRVGNNVNQITQKINSAGGVKLNAREYRIIEEMRDLLKQIANDIVK